MRGAASLRRFSNCCGVSGIVPCGFFLRKKPHESIGSALYQLENRYTDKKRRPSSGGVFFNSHHKNQLALDSILIA
jgi:hypothetical protein